MPLKQVGFELGFGPAKISGVWEPDGAERDAAWELYVELVTRVSVAPLQPGDGILRESLTSLYSLFAATREILRKYGPTVAKPPAPALLDGPQQYRFGHLAVWMLNAELRPVLSHWHPELQRWEALRDPATSIVAHEEQWARAEEFRGRLETLRGVLLGYASVLAKVCDAPALIDATNEIAARDIAEGSAQ